MIFDYLPQPWVNLTICFLYTVPIKWAQLREKRNHGMGQPSLYIKQVLTTVCSPLPVIQLLFPLPAGTSAEVSLLASHFSNPYYPCLPLMFTPWASLPEAARAPDNKPTGAHPLHSPFYPVQDVSPLPSQVNVALLPFCFIPHRRGP